MKINNKDNIATYRCCECEKKFTVLNVTAHPAMDYFKGQCCHGRIAGFITRKQNWFRSERVDWVMVELNKEVIFRTIDILSMRAAFDGVVLKESDIEKLSTRYFESLPSKYTLMNVQAFQKFYPNLLSWI